ncbi:MAG: hypothetical protein ABIU87_07100 [Ornithinibacter sp.]
MSKLWSGVDISTRQDALAAVSKPGGAGDAGHGAGQIAVPGTRVWVARERR